MSNRSIGLDDRLQQYVLDVSLRESPVLAELRGAMREHPRVNMQIAPEQGQFMAWLAELMGVRRAIEVGVFTGYSALAVAEVLPADGCLVACDISEEYSAIARDYWRRAGVAERIDLQIRPAAETLQALIDAGQAGSYDFAFIDADKPGYAGYYEQCLQLLRTGGVVAVDNVLWHGDVVDASRTDADTAAIRAFNEQVRDDHRVAISLVPIGDGLLLARKLG